MHGFGRLVVFLSGDSQALGRWLRVTWDWAPFMAVVSFVGFGDHGGSLFVAYLNQWENRTWFDCHRWFDHAGLIGHPVSEQPHGKSL